MIDVVIFWWSWESLIKYETNKWIKWENDSKFDENVKTSSNLISIIFDSFVWFYDDFYLIHYVTEQVDQMIEK